MFISELVVQVRVGFFLLHFALNSSNSTGKTFVRYNNLTHSSSFSFLLSDNFYLNQYLLASKLDFEILKMQRSSSVERFSLIKADSFNSSSVSLGKDKISFWLNSLEDDLISLLIYFLLTVSLRTQLVWLNKTISSLNSESSTEKQVIIGLKIDSLGYGY